MSVACQRWELRAAGAPSVGCNKITTEVAAAQSGNQLYASESTSSAVLRRSQQQQQLQQQQPHELPACNLSSFSMYVHQYPAATTTIGGDTAKIHLPGTAVSKASSPHPQTLSVHWEAAHHPDASSKQTMVATVSSTLLLPDTQESKAAEEQRWTMSAAAADAVHKLPGSAMRLNVVTPFYGTQGGLSFMIKTTEAVTTADYTTAAALPKAESYTRPSPSTDLKNTVQQQSCAVKKAAVAASCSPSSASSSSIFNRKEPSSCSSESDIANSGDMQEAQSAYRGPLHQMSALESSLPIKRPGLSKFFGGKSRSFSSLADVSSVSDLAKPNNPYAKRRRIMGTLNNGPLDHHHRHRSYPPLSRTSVASISKKPANNRRLRTTNSLTIAIKLGGLREAEEAEETEEDEEEEEDSGEAKEMDYVHAHLPPPAAAASSRNAASLMTRSRPSRSFSLTDLPVVLPPQPSSSPPTNSRKRFAPH